MKNDFTSTHSALLTARSTTLAISMEFSSGGPGSNLAEALGSSSAFVMSTPSLGLSANGFNTSNLFATRTVVSPIVAMADPSAVVMTPRWTVTGLIWPNVLPSNLMPLLSVFPMTSLLIWDIIMSLTSSPMSSPLHLLFLALLVESFERIRLDFVHLVAPALSHVERLDHLVFREQAVHLHEQDLPVPV